MDNLNNIRVTDESGRVPDVNVAVDFLTGMHPTAPWVLTVLDPENVEKSITATFGVSAEAKVRTFIERWNGERGLYFSTNPLRMAMSKKAKATDVAALTYLHVDIDPHAGEDIEVERARILSLLTDRLPAGVPKPTAIVFSGGGYQAFWKLETPLELDGSQAAADKAKLWNLGLEHKFGCADSCHNIDRIMRLPGTINVPNKKKRERGRVPTLAKIVDADWSRAYPLSSFEPAPPPTPSALPKGDNDNAAFDVDPDVTLVKLVDVNDLDKHTADVKPIADRVKTIIQVGFDPDDDRLNGKDKTNRSLWVLDACCALVRRGVPDNVILSVLLDRDFRISDHIHDRKGDTRKYAIRQIERAKKFVARSAAEFELNKSGLPFTQSQRNVEIALAKMDLTVKLDAFRNHMLVQGLEANDVVIDDRIMTRLRFETDRRFKFLCAKNFYFDVVGDIAFRNAFHPVRDYLSDLAWDGEGRLDDWLIRYCGAEDNDFVRAVGCIVLVAAVRRIRNPGVKFDEMLVLEGAQGLGKSQVLNALAVKEEWFTDEVPLAGDGKLAIEALNGRWIAEAAELKGMRNKEVEHLKAFLSRTHDRGRLAYDRITSEVPRQFIIIGTTNSEHYLMDMTGNRRFWPVHVNRADVEELVRDRDQLWAEAAHREAQGESIRLPEKLWTFAGEEQAKRVLEDPYLGTLAAALEGRSGKILSEDVFRLLGIPAGQRIQAQNTRIGEAMRRLGWRRERVRRDGTLQYCYLNCANQDAPWLGLTDTGDGYAVRTRDGQHTNLPF